MKRKYTLTAIYLLGWFYPLSILVFNIIDNFIVIREPFGCPYDFNNDTMIGWVFYGLLLALVTFLIYFITLIVKFKVSKIFYLTLLNMPLLFLLITFAWNYIYAESLNFNIITLAISLTAVVLSIVPIFRSDEKNT